MKFLRLAALAGLCLLSSSALAQQANLFKNPSFEHKTGDWRVQATMAQYGLLGGSPNAGIHAFNAWCGSYCGKATWSLAQVLDTTPGQSYDVSFFSQLYAFGVPTGHISVLWDGERVAEFHRDRGFYLRHDVTNLVATSDKTMFELVATVSTAQEVTSQATFAFDDFAAVASLSAVPEPASVPMALAGLAVVGYMARRRSRRAAGDGPT